MVIESANVHEEECDLDEGDGGDVNAFECEKSLPSSEMVAWGYEGHRGPHLLMADKHVGTEH